ncbi:hypothetical protein VTO58DRAFT_106507 [Aureobasidium pullulans]
MTYPDLSLLRWPAVSRIWPQSLCGE